MFGVGAASCTTAVQLNDVFFDRSARLIYSETTDHWKCGFLDLNGSIAFIVALARDALPESPYAIQLRAQPTCRSCTEHEDRVTL